MGHHAKARRRLGFQNMQRNKNALKVLGILTTQFNVCTTLQKLNLCDDQDAYTFTVQFTYYFFFFWIFGNFMQLLKKKNTTDFLLILSQLNI